MLRHSLTVCLLLAVFLAAAFLQVGEAPADAGGVPHKQGEVIIKFKDNASQHDKDQILAELGGTKIKGLGRIKAELRRLDDGVSVEEAVSRFHNNSKIEYIEPNYILYADEIPNDPMFPQMWAMQNTGQTGGTAGADIHATNAWDVFTGSSSVLVGVIDTGVDYTHPDLAANIWTNPGEIPGNGIDDDGNGYIDDIHGWDFINNDNDPMDDNGHGSHVSGTIGAVGGNGIGVVGVNWHIKIMGLKFLSAGGSGSTADAVDAIYYATMMGCKLTSNSWGGGGFSQAMLDAINDANAHGVLFVAAAGNESSNCDVTPHYPSNYDAPNVISVAATDHNDALASFSNYGATTVDLAAPGVDILSTFPGNSYGSISGTSMATPHVSGALGLIFGRFPAIGHLDARNLLLNFVDPIPAMVGKCVTEGRLNAFLPIAEPDSIAPGMVTDLAVSSVASNSIQVDWTAPGDDDYTGTASRYEMRYSTAPITDLNFDAAMLAPNPPDPGAAGTPESMTVGGLDFITTYYFALRAFDEFGNASPASNSPMGTTLGAPDIDVTPLSLSETLLTGATSTQSLTLSNLNGNTTLDFQIPIPDLITNQPVIQTAVEIPKGGDDLRTGNPVIEGTGGPDGFGYRWVDNDEPFGPVFNWTDISGTGTPAITSGDDENAGPFPLGFTFSYYGAEYDAFYICSNGWMSFTSTSTAYSNQPLPSAGSPGTLVAPFWDDLILGAGTIYYQSDGSRLIVQWTDVSHYAASGPAGGPYTFQAIVRADGTMKFQYLDMGAPDNSATVGIQNASGSDGLEIAFNTTYVHNGLALRIEAVPQWLNVSPTAGTILGPGLQGLSVDFDANGLLGGDYEGNIRVISNDPDESPFTIPVMLTVIGAPDIAVDPASHDFGPVFQGATPSFAFTVGNPGTDSLHVSGVSVPAPFSADMNTFVVPPRGEVALTVTFNAAVLGMYSETMTISSDDPDQPTVDVDLAGEAVVPPDFSVSPTSLSSALLSGQSEAKQLTLTNSGGADLEFSLEATTEAEVLGVEPLGIDQGKGEENPQPGVLGSGGPDVFGYTWKDSDEPGGPAFDWVDISGTGTAVYSGNADDSNLGPFPIGFNFPFYGNDFGTFRVSSNGFVTFTSTSSDLSNDILPGTGGPENLLAVYWDDMYVDADIPSQVYYANDGGRLIVQFDQIRRYGQSDTSPPFYSFEVILYPNGTFVYQYLTVESPVNTSATIGMQNDARDDGLTVVYNDLYVHDNLAIAFRAGGNWLTASPSSGVIPPGGSLPVQVTFDAADLFGGFYQGSVDITTNDPLASLVQIPATMQVTGAPDIVVDPLSIDFGQVFVGYPDAHAFTIRNEGTDVLVISEINTDNPVFFVDFSELTLPLELEPFQQVLVNTRFSPTVAGPQSGNLTVVSSDPDSPNVDVAVSGEGLLPPIASLTPASLSADLLTGETELQHLMLSNTGNSDLTYEVQVLTTGPAEVLGIEPLGVDLAKGEEDTRPGVLGSGGPDTFGYSWTDSDEPGGPVFDWVDISGTGTPIYAGNADDSNQGPFPIGFDFNFYGTAFSTFRVSSNGFVTFTSTSSDLSNDILPGTGGPENLLAAYWDDMYVDADIPSQVYYEYDGNRLIVQFDQIRRYGQSDTSPPFYSFEILLYPNGAIVYQYLTVEDPVNTSATIGIQNATRDDGLTVVYNDAYVHDGLAIRIATLPEWLTVTPASGVLPPGGSVNLNAVFDATGLFGGDYTGAVRVLNNDPAHGVLESDAMLHVTGVPRIGFSAESVDFGDVFIGYPEMQMLTVTNVGTDHLSVSSITPGLGDYSVSPTTLELDPLQSADLTLTLDPASAGDRSSDLTFASNDPDSPHMVALTGNGVVPPVASAAPDTVVGAALPGGSKTKTLTICNTGGSDLTFDLASAENAPDAVQVHTEVITPKGQDIPGGDEPVDPRPGILGSGGPDTFGYSWTDSDEPGGPVYDWVDLTGVGTDVGFGSYSDDGNVGPFPVGFDFSFYGNTFDQFYVCSNGWVSFTNTGHPYSNQPLPNSGSAVPENLLAAFWDDMVFDTSYAGRIQYYNDGSRLIIEFSVRRIATYTPPFYNFEIILYPNGRIVYQYNTLGATTNSATIGIQNATKDDGLTVAFNEDYVHEGLAVQFSSQPAWLSVDPTSGTVPAGECVDVSVMMDAAALEAGDYTGMLTLNSNDPANPTLTNEVVFHVGSIDVSYMSMDPNTMNLGASGNWIKAVVELPAPYDVNDIVLETVRMNGTVPAARMTIGDDNNNGIPDATFKFDRSLAEDVMHVGDEVPVTITGEIMDVIYFSHTDYVRCIQPQLQTLNGGEQLAGGSSVLIAWQNPQGWQVDHAAVTFSPDGGQTWSLIADQVQGTSVAWTVPNQETEQGMVEVYLYDTAGIMGFDLSDGPFSVASQVVGVEQQLPNVKRLYQNSPNPFQSATRIAFDLPEAARVELRIFDVSGRVQRVLSNQTWSAGAHVLSWDGRDGAGRELAAGIYFYQLKAGDFVATKRMFLSR